MVQVEGMMSFSCFVSLPVEPVFFLKRGVLFINKKVRLG